MAVPPRSVFNARVELYDAMIRWERRLAHEGPFYRRLLEQVGGRRVLDAACGTGRHARMFHGWGLEVEGADLSEAMIAFCRSMHGEPAGLRWVVRSFTEPADPPGRFDLAVCVGNSLALADDKAPLADALRALLESLRPGGAFVVQVLNLWKIPEGPTLWQKFERVRVGGTDRILIKGIHRAGERAHIELLAITPNEDGGLEHEAESSSFLGLTGDDLITAARDAGAERISLYGDYQYNPYQPTTSADLILVGHRPS